MDTECATVDPPPETVINRVSIIEALLLCTSLCSTRITPRQPPVRVNVSVYACVLIPTRKHYANTRHDSYYRISPYKPSISPNDSPYKPTDPTSTSLARSVRRAIPVHRSIHVYPDPKQVLQQCVP